MAIFQECPNCKRLCGIRPSVKVCPKCGEKLPRKRAFVVEWRMPGEDGHLTKKKKKKLGQCSLDEARAFEAQQRKLRHVPPPPPVLMWGQVCDRYIDMLESEEASKAYQRDSRRYLDRMAGFWGVRTPVTQINHHMIQDFRVMLRKDKGLSRASCDRHLAAGKAAWHYSVDLPNPFSKVTMFNPDNEVTRYLSDQERVRLLDAAARVSEPLYQMIVVALVTGLRKSNILNLRRDQLNSETGTLTVQQKGHRIHMAFLPWSVVEMLQGIPDNGTPWFWISPLTGKPYDKDWRRPWIAAKRLAGIDPEFRFHDLRHDAGTSIYRLRGDLKMAQKFLGHSQIQTTMRYAHLPDEDLIDAVRKIDPLKPRK